MTTPETLYLALYLDAPLQSWGYQSRFDRRTTLSYPTRSGILGLLSAAMGIDRADTQSLAQFAELRITVLTFRRHPTLVDFHTVGGGYDDKTEKANIPCSPSGKPHRVVSYREYLQYSLFGAIVEGPAPQLQEIAAALADPKWGVWLGRKACIPASPVCQGTFGSYPEALERLEQLAGCPASRVVREVEQFADGNDTLMDRPLDFRKREFAPRRVQVDP